MRLHREGNATILLVLLLGAGLSVGTHYTGPMWLAVAATSFSLIVLAIVLNFFRYPRVPTLPDDDKVIAPCMGKVVVIEEVDDPTLGRCRQLSIFMSPIDIHVNYSPIAATVQHYEYRKGKYLMAWDPKSSTDNEQTWLILESRGERLGMKQIAGFLARRIVCYAKAGTQLQPGQEYGFIKFGSRVDLLLPLSWNITVKLGDRTVGGRTVVAQRA